MKKNFRFTFLGLFFSMLLLVGTSLRAQQQRPTFQYDYKTHKVIGEKSKGKLENTVIVKLKPAYATFLEQHNNTIKDLLYPLDLLSINPLFKNKVKNKSTQPAKEDTIQLELIYVLHYQPSSMDMDGTIRFLKGLGYFQYVEPYFTPAPATPYYTNDTEAQPGGAQYFHINRVQAFDAWNIQKGDPNIIIGIVDTGFDIMHDDLKNQYVTGYDLADGDSDVVHPTEYHGTWVAGVCSGEADNNIGVTGIGFKCRFMPIKATPDAGNAIVAGYQGIQYAADNGCKIINLSWGGLGGYSSTLQDAINYAAITKDVVIVAAGGNYDTEGDFYPASYDNVMSVAALDTITDATAGHVIDIRSRFRDIVAGLASTLSTNIDIAAFGTGLITTDHGNGYIGQSGTSLSSPFIAGAAAIVRAQYPNMTALQVIEMLRVTADTFYQYTENQPFFEKIGKGRLNLYRAITDVTSPSIRMRAFDASGKHGSYLLVNDTVTLSLDLWNYLRKTNNLSIYLSCSSSDVTVVTSGVNAGVIDSMTGITTSAAYLPLKFKINPSAGFNETIKFRLGFVDPVNGYSDYQYFSLVINPSMLNIYTDKIISTITTDGHLGFDANQNGEGYQYDSTNVLYEAGFLLGKHGNVSDCVRGTSASPDADFQFTMAPTYIDPAYKDMEIRNKFNDSLAGVILGLSVEQRSYTFNQPGLNQCFIAEYQITNNTAAAIDTLYAALFFDWDIGPGTEYSRNRAGFDYTRKLGYAYSTVANRPYTGVELLTKENVTYYAMDNGTVPDVSNINPNSGAWNSTLKYKCMNNGVGRASAGMTSSNGFDISNMTGAQILNIAPGEVRTVAFAILAADNLSSLQTNADNIKTKFVQMKTSKNPIGATYYLCENQTKDITFAPGNGNNFNFYNLVTDINKIATGQTYVLHNASTADTLFAAGADSLYESTSRAALYINSATAQASFGTQTTTLTIPSNETLYMFNSSQNYTTLNWDYGDGNSDVNITNPSHSYTVPDVYSVTLTASDDKGCSSTQQKTITVSLTTGIKVYPNPATKSVSFGNDILDAGTLQFINSVGQVLYQKDNIVLSDQTVFDVIQWPEGVYTVVFNTDKKQYIEHLLIRR
ncbi:MAG: in-like serine protease [Chitinophagaceae bacterium]|nr:in-like serine protease [Chitinophagaceae bacterium]